MWAGRRVTKPHAAVPRRLHAPRPARQVGVRLIARRGSRSADASSPGQAMTYQIGKLQLLRMLADAKRVQGDRFALRAFHDSVWKNGNVPLSLQRWELLGMRDELDLADAA